MRTCDICGDNFTPAKQQHGRKRCSKKCWNKARTLSAQKVYQKHLVEYRAKAKVKQAELRKDNPELKLQQKDSYLELNYGISIAEYAWMNYLQDGKCAICKQPCMTGKALAVDHNHETGKVRKLLCSKHNQGLGLYGDDPILLLEAANYLIGEMA